MLILLGIAVLLRSAAPLGVALSFGVLMDRTYIRVEEAMLRKEFGEAWRTYEAGVRRWV